MPVTAILKYGFRIRTRGGVVVENLAICGRDEQEAKGKLFRIYQGCQILEARCLPATPVGRNVHYSYEDVMDMIVAR